MSYKNILVTGSTGKQGGSVLSAKHAGATQQFYIFALTRNLNPQSTIHLGSKGVAFI
jgi:uncharacterized protein YbjT (DUF2867 family)